MMSLLTAVAATVVLFVWSATALATWSMPRVLSVTRFSPYAGTAVAVDSRGDAAVAWETVGSWPVQSHGRRCLPGATTRGCFPVSSVHVAVRTARGRLVTRTPWSGRINPSMHLSVVLSGQGVTLAWGYYNSPSAGETARVAYGRLIGRWSPSRAIGSFSDEEFTSGTRRGWPKLAVLARQQPQLRMGTRLIPRRGTGVGRHAAARLRAG